jgi:hypothetical protein
MAAGAVLAVLLVSSLALGSECAKTDPEKQFFADLKKEAPDEALVAIVGSPCQSSTRFAGAFRSGFAQGFEAERYLPTFGRFNLHPLAASKIKTSPQACAELQAKGTDPQERACCLSGYLRGEQAFKVRLQRAEIIPAQCSDEFRRGTLDGTKQCELVHSGGGGRCFIPRNFQCQGVCYSFGWNQALAPCLEKSEWVKREGQSNRSIDFRPAYAPAPANDAQKRPSIEAETAR